MRGCGEHLRGRGGGLTGADLWARRAKYIRAVRTGSQHGGGAGQQGGDGTPRGVWCVGCRSCGAAFSLRGTTHSLVVPRHPTHTPLVDGSRLWNGRSVYVKLSVNHSLDPHIPGSLTFWNVLVSRDRICRPPNDVMPPQQCGSCMTSFCQVRRRHRCVIVCSACWTHKRRIGCRVAPPARVVPFGAIRDAARGRCTHCVL